MSTGNRTKYLFMIVYFRGVKVLRTVSDRLFKLLNAKDSLRFQVRGRDL